MDKQKIKARAESIWGQDRDHPQEERPPLPKNMLVEITNGCNHACVFCANTYMQRKIGRIDPDFMDRLMSQAAAGGTEEIGFYTTGEPLVHKQLEQFVARASELGFRYKYISTNGALASPKRMRTLIDAGLNSIKFSVNAGTRDSYAKVHGKDDWDTVMANIRAVSEYRDQSGADLTLAVSFIMTRQVEHEQDALRAAVGDLVDEIYMVPCGNQTGNMMSVTSLLAPDNPDGRTDGGTCPLPFMRLHVSVEGYLTLCCTDYQNYLAVADLNEMSLMDAWHSEGFVDMRRRHLTGDLAGTLCGNCWLGRKDAIDPLRPDLADVVDFQDLYETQSEQIKKRL